MPINVQQYHRKVSPTPSAGRSVGINPAVASQPYREIARAGDVLTGVGLEYLKIHEQAEVNDQFSNAKVDATRQFNEYKRSLMTNPDTKTYEKGLEDVHASIQASSAKTLTNRRAKDAFSQWYNSERERVSNNVLTTKLRVEADQFEKNHKGRVAIFQDQYAATGDDIYKKELLKEFMSTGQIEVGVDENGEPTGEIRAVPGNEASLADYMEAVEKAEKKRAVVAEEEIEQTVENIKPSLVAEMRSGEAWEKDQHIAAKDRRRAMDVAEANLAGMVQDGIMTPAQAVEEQKNLNNWIDNYAEEYTAKKEAEKKQTTLEITADLTGQIAKGDMEYATIANSGLSKTEQKKWNGYLSDSYKNPAPKKATDGGMVASVGTVLDVAMLTMEPQEAHDILLEERYVEHSITDDQLRWATDKIANPYPKEIVPDLRATLADNREGHNRLWHADTERNTEVNEALLAWLDSQLAQGKTPTRKEMYGRSSQIRVDAMEIPRLLDLGQVITRYEQEYEVVGFDDTGEALLEPIE